MFICMDGWRSLLSYDTHKTENMDFAGQFRRFVIQFDNRVIQIREINLCYSNSHVGLEI